MRRNSDDMLETHDFGVKIGYDRQGTAVPVAMVETRGRTEVGPKKIS